MPLEDPEEVHDIAIHVVNHLQLRPRRAAEEHPAHADEWLDIAGVGDGGDALTDAARKSPLAAQPGGNRLDGTDTLQGHGQVLLRGRSRRSEKGSMASMN